MKAVMPELALFPAPVSTGNERQLPRNIEAEAAFLGAILIDNRVVEDLPVQLTAAHFFEPLHGRIYGHRDAGDAEALFRK
jgi:replicative DNA helicase